MPEPGEMTVDHVLSHDFLVQPIGLQEHLPPVTDIEAERGRHEILQPELAAGDCTPHHGLTLHAGPDPDPARRARQCAVRAGAALDRDLWPVVWRPQLDDRRLSQAPKTLT